ncbi:MAG: NAD(P)H-dependent flavin oxidoreductase [Planctomycetota bacterium]
MQLLEKLWKKGKDFLGVDYPIICGGMTWVSDFALVKAVSEAGAFPVLAGGNMPPELFEKEVDRCINELDGKPFAVNLVVIAPAYPDLFNICIKKDVPFVVFAGNMPKKSDVERMKEAGKKVMSFASTESIAQRLVRFGVDALILEGSEAGGHIGYVSLMVLLQQVLFKVDEVPVFVAGGLATGRMMAHMHTMGAAGCQFGTLFVMSEECSSHDKFKEAFRKAHARSALSTPQYDSRLPVVAVRGIKNQAMDDFGKLQLEMISKLEQNEVEKEEAMLEIENFWMGSLRRAVVDGDTETGSLMAGQSVGLLTEVKPVKAIVTELIDDASAELERVKNALTT